MQPIDDQVIDHAALFVQHQRVLPLPDGEFRDIVGEEVVEECPGVRAADEKFAHVGDIENPGGFADSFVFLDDAGVLHGHIPAAEIDEPRAQFLVGGEEGSFL